ncbi:LysR family transcriptional regulator [Agrobacterium sp. DKPNP3]|uniref:LysR family transcriptional regulator n=1 Tax=Agrobacterium sp. DKPNP3 TaxID=3457323 RepID=UPI004043FCBF
MELKLLRAFVQVAKTGHYGIAASRLNITQSTLSKQILALEHQVGGSIFERGRHGAKLTPLGSLLLKEADRLLKLSDEISGKLTRARSGLAGHLDIGFGISTLELVPRLVAAFRAGVPDCEITLNDMSTSEQHRHLRNGTLDLGFCRAPLGDDLSFQSVMEESLALVVPRGTKMPPLDHLSHLNALGFVALLPERGSGLAAQIDRWCGAARFEPRTVQYADDILTVHAIVAAGLGVAFLPLTGVSALSGSTDNHPLQGEAASWPVGICWRREAENPLLMRFIDFVVG